MIRRTPRFTRTDSLFPYPTLFRSPVLGIGDDLAIYTPKNTPVSHLSMHDAIQYYRLARHVTDRLAKGPKVITLPAKPNWAQLDMAERIIQKSGNPAKVTFPEEMDRQDRQDVKKGKGV